jgi:general stress protein YciG
MKKTDIPDDVLEYFRKQGAKGGKTRAKKYTKEQLSEMGKKGGRPKGSGKKRAKKATTNGTE